MRLYKDGIVRQRSFVIEPKDDGLNLNINSLCVFSEVEGLFSKKFGAFGAQVVISSAFDRIRFHAMYGDIGAYLTKIELICEQMSSFVASLFLGKHHNTCVALNPLAGSFCDAGGSSAIMGRHIPDIQSAEELRACIGDTGTTLHLSSGLSLSDCGNKLSIRRSVSFLLDDDSPAGFKAEPSLSMEKYLHVLNSLRKRLEEHMVFVRKWTEYKD